MTDSSRLHKRLDTRRPTATPRGIAADLSQKGADHEAIAARAIRSPAVLDEALEGLGARPAPVKFGSLKVLRLVAERAPEVLIPKIDAFVDLLGSENSILKWGAILIVGELAAAAPKPRIEAILDRLLAPIPGPEMIAAANAIHAGAKAARAHPALAGRILKEILKVEGASYKTAECRNVAIGQALEALESILDILPEKKLVHEFAERQLGNTRNATRKKAERLLEHEGGRKTSGSRLQA
jgi:hypothetical protein